MIWNMPVCDTKCLQNERQALLDIYYELDGENWATKWDIESNNAIVNTSLHCNWYGILCDNKTQHILALDLFNNNLSGNVHTNGTINLKFLLSFRIDVSNVYGALDKILATMPKYLIRLNLAYTKVDGEIPKEIANNVPLLSKLQLSGSQIHGEIPDSIGNLTHLMLLSLGGTKLQGSIPQSISMLKNLWFLDLQDLKLTGNLSVIHNLTQLVYLHLSSNKITGVIPEDIGERCPNLTEILLQDNKISGHLPRSIGMLSNLEILNVAKNKLSKLLPKDLLKLNNLKVLILSWNDFPGFEKSSNGTFKHLNIFMASHLSAFSCSLRTILSYLAGSARTIMQIDISHCNIYGDLPGFVFSFERLTFLKMAFNHLSGPIPSTFHNLPYFTLLDLQHNNFQGQIPSTFQRFPILTELNIKGNKQMKGPVIASFLILDYTMSVSEQDATCPIVKFAHNNGTIFVDSSYYDRKYCSCDDLYFGNGKVCFKCMDGGNCTRAVTGSSHLNSVNQTIVNNIKPLVSPMFLMQGYFPFPNESDVKSIHKCPSSGYFYKICVPSKQCGCYVNTTGRNAPIQGRMMNHTRIHCSKSCLCLRGHHGRYCSRCIKGYYKEGIRCYQCPEGPRKDLQFGILFGSTIGIIIFSVGVLFFSTKRLKSSIALALFEVVLMLFLLWKHLIPAAVLQIVIIIFILGFSSHLQRCTALLKSAMFYMQVMDSLVSTTDIWPKSIYSLQVYISSSFNLSFSSLACTFPSFFTILAKSVVVFSLPFAFVGLFFLACLIYRLVAKPTEQKLTEFSCKCRKYSIAITDVAYFPIVRSCFSSIVGCDSIEGVSFMKSFAWIDCNSSEHNYLAVVAVLELILYVLAVPFFIYLPLLIYNRRHLSDDDSPISKSLSPLIAPYKPKYRPFIEVVMLLRRLLIAILMASFPANSSLQTQFVIILLLAAIIFQAIARPFKNPTVTKYTDDRCYESLGLENGIDIFMLSCVLLSFVCVGLSAGHGNSVPTALFTTLMLINGIFLIAFCCSIFYRLFRCRSNKENYGDSSDLHDYLIDVVEEVYMREAPDG